MTNFAGNERLAGVGGRFLLPAWAAVWYTVLDRYRGYPVCMAGERAGPPEDCGGPCGYVELLKTLKNRKHPEHKRLLEWVGGKWDAEAFDLDGINRSLKKLWVERHG